MFVSFCGCSSLVYPLILPVFVGLLNHSRVMGASVSFSDVDEVSCMHMWGWLKYRRIGIVVESK